MAREIKTTNRRKDEIETSQGKLTVGRNHEGGEYNSVEDTILYMYDYSRTVTIGLAEAKRLHAAIGEVIADAEQIIEDAKPKALTTAELDALALGARVSIDTRGDYREFLKTEKGDFVKVIGGTNRWAEGYVYTSAALSGIVFKKEDN